MITFVFLYFHFYIVYNEIIWQQYAQNAKARLYQISQIIKPYKSIKCVTHVEAKNHVNVACLNYDKFNLLITELHESIETSKQI